MTQMYYRQSPVSQLGRATLYLLIANIAVFGLSIFAPALVGGWLSLIPNRLLFRGELWRLGSYLFIHGDFSHLLFNMLGLFFFGPVMERVLGYRRFWIFYFLCGCGSGLVAALFYFSLGNGDAVIIGASGAIFGIITGYGVLFPNSTIYWNFFLPIKAKWLVLIYGVLQLFATLQYAGGARSGIASIAHLSGIIIAYFYLRGISDLRRLVLKYKYWRAERERQRRFKVYSGKDGQTYH